MSFLDRIAACNTADTSAYLPFRVDGQQVGWLRPAFAQHLAAWPEVFALDDAGVRLLDSVQGAGQRTETIAGVIHSLIDQGVIGYDLQEPYPVTTGDRDRPLFLMDRGAVVHFGIRAFGQHLNGYVHRNDGLSMWIGRRASDRRIAPGKLDNLVAGGLPHGIGLMENLAKECDEEAGMSAALAREAVPAGSISYLAEAEQGLKPDVMYCYDLELPDGFVPVCNDGEVESFELMPIEEVAAIVRDSDDFKPNCSLVIIDFLIRHGLLGPGDPEYAELLTGLRRIIP
jgi:isopentenyldiphosphate isomerase